MMGAKSSRSVVLRTSCFRRAPATFLAVLVILFTVAGAVVLPAIANATGAPISGTGSSFATPAIEQWVNTVRAAALDLSVSYTATNSGTGRYEFTNQTTNFGVTDIGYTGNTDTTPPSFPFDFVPIVGEAIAFTYNVPGLTKRLQLTSYTACAILTGGITNWDSASLAADNPGVTLPNLVIVPVIESDSSVTNYAMEQWCIAEQPVLWATFVHAQESQAGGPSDGVALSPTTPYPNWPGIAGGDDDQSTDAVAGNVEATSGAIGAVQPLYAVSGSNPAENVALVKNASGDYTAPTSLDVTSALTYATPRDNGSQQLDLLIPSCPHNGIAVD
jgi:phosphate transport system substrate-binding protein